MKQGSLNGFTLVELLVVIAILSVLAAVLFPVFYKVREKGRQVSCLNNMKQLGLAMMQYTQDYDEKFTGSDYYGQGWAEHLYPYVKSKQAYVCPDDNRPASVVGGIQWSNLPFQPDIVSYVANVDILGPTRVQNPSVPLSTGQILSPATTVLLYEGNHAYSAYDGPDSSRNVAVGDSNVCRLDPAELGGTDDSSEVGDGSGDPDEIPVDVARHQADSSVTGVIHNGHLNFVLADGHVKFVDAAWDNTSGTVSVGDLPENSNLFSALGQKSLTGTHFVLSLNPNP